MGTDLWDIEVMPHLLIPVDFKNPGRSLHSLDNRIFNSTLDPFPLGKCDNKSAEPTLRSSTHVVGTGRGPCYGPIGLSHYLCSREPRDLRPFLDFCGTKAADLWLEQSTKHWGKSCHMCIQHTCVTESKQETHQITDCCMLQVKNNGGKAMMGPGQNPKSVSVSTVAAGASWHLSIPRKLSQPAFVCPNLL